MKFKNGLLYLLTISVINLLVMHYTVFLTCNVERQIDFTVFIDNFGIVVCEVLIITLVFSIFLMRRIRLAAFMCSVVTVLWSFCNVVYARFFSQYLTASAIGEGGNLLHPFIIKCLVDGVRWRDVIYLISFVFSFLIFRRIPDYKLSMSALKHGALAVISVLVIDVASHTFFCVLTPSMRYISYVKHRISLELLSQQCYSAQPIYSHFQRGSVRTLGFQMMEIIRGTLELSPVQIELIQKEIDNLKPRQICASSHPDIRNVIFIIIESYMSFTVDLKVGGVEITPFLNSLKRDPETYYNGKMNPNITIGESSDGQFIYMTGLLPLRSAITITEARKHSFPGLPRQLTASRKMNTRMVIPTAPSMWNQNIMCKQYGVEKLYSTSEYRKSHSMYLSDEQIFDLADSIDASLSKSFFSMVLTFSMHQPYIEQIDESFKINEPAYSRSLNNYLNACHYTDRQLRTYFDHLKRKHIFENSLIVIASDHHVAENALELPKDFSNRKLPFFIINGDIEPSKAWKGECNQLDVYTTLLDVLGVDAPWLGLGHSLVSVDYTNSVDEKKWNYSEWIIKSDYFNR